MTSPRPGWVVRVDGDASVQFAGDRGLTMRIIRIVESRHCDGWAWVDGYIIDGQLMAVDRRQVYVRLAGLSAPG